MADENTIKQVRLIQTNEQLVKTLNDNFAYIQENTVSPDDMSDELNKKVDKVTGKDLSTNDFDNTYKSKLDGLDSALAGKVDKETGKGLSSNDYTTTEKNKLSGIAAGAQVNVLEGIQINGTDVEISGKKANIPYDLSSFITASVNNLANYYKKSETYTQAEVNALIGAIKTIEIKVVASLPATGESNVIYLVAKGGGKTGYIEYVWVASDNKFEEIGDTDIDLSNYPTITEMNTAISNALATYYTKTQVDTALGNKVDKVTGKGLSANDFTNEYKAQLDGLSDALDEKVDKVSGKDLSTNDYTDADKAIVDGVTAGLAGKVDKVAGKDLSTNDFTNAYKSQLDGLDTALSSKVDKVTGKGLSTNDYTTTEKNKLSNIEAGANKVEVITFTSDDSRWSATATNGVYRLTITTSAKSAIAVQILDEDSTSSTYNCYLNVMANAGFDGSHPIVLSDEKFTGRVFVV